MAKPQTKWNFVLMTYVTKGCKILLRKSLKDKIMTFIAFILETVKSFPKRSFIENENINERNVERS